jgi:cytochrome c peroxidase
MLNEKTKAMVLDALNDEYKARAFKTTTLRSITETAPYMHDGVFKMLEEVVDFLDQGGGQNPNAVNPPASHAFAADYYDQVGEPNPNLSPLMKPLELTQQEKSDLIGFLKALIGEPVKLEMPKLSK